jgi:hypothetical protein
VWLVREGDPGTTEGTLSLEDQLLRFVPSASASETVSIPLSGLERVRRGRGSPLLSLTYRDPEGARKLFFYFAKPPPLPGSTPSAPTPMDRWGRGLERSAAAMTLRASNRLLKKEVGAWVEALREAAG